MFDEVPRTATMLGWELINPYGTPEAESMLTFETEDDAVASAELVRQRVSKLPVERL
jgi:hypothetical protein